MLRKYGEKKIRKLLTLFHAALGLMAQGNCDLTLHKEGEF
jgi:hypothetical protein